MNKTDTEYFKAKLEAEKSVLETEMAEIGQKNPSATKGWEATSKNIEVDAADDNEVADKFEEYEENNGILNQLENQLAEVNAAIDRLKKETYGTCEICGQPIEKERLEANSSSRISIKHAHTK